MWVWIPVYAYSITSGYHSSSTGTIEIKFLKESSNVAYNKNEMEQVHGIM